MRKLIILPLVAIISITGCSKHNSAGTSAPYYFTYNHGAIAYSTKIDSLVLVQTGSSPTATWFSLLSSRTQEQTDSAVAGLLALSTWTIDCIYFSTKDSVRTGTYISDTTISMVHWVGYNSQFRFYYKSDPQQGSYSVSPGLPFSVTVTAATPDYLEGTFEGKLVKGLGVDTTSVSNGKFKLPRR